MRQQTSNSPTREQLVDEFGELDRQVTAFAPTAKRYKALQDEIRAWYQNHPADQPAEVEGSRYKIQITACGQERKLSLKAKLAIFARLKKARFIELASFTLDAIEKAPEMGKDFLERIATKQNSGSRKLIAVLKAPAA